MKRSDLSNKKSRNRVVLIRGQELEVDDKDNNKVLI
jgi:hypothetical protein